MLREFPVWYKTKLKIFIGNKKSEVSGITEFFVRVCKDPLICAGNYKHLLETTSSVTSSWSESSLKCITAFKASFQKKTRGKRALVSQLCRVRARTNTGRREESKKALDSLVANSYPQYCERVSLVTLLPRQESDHSVGK